MVKSYDLALVVCTLMGIPIKGSGETDFITFEWDSEIVKVTKSADGDSIYSRLNNKDCTVTITLHQKSSVIPLLMGIIETQHGDQLGVPPPLIVPAPFVLVDVSTGDSIVGVGVMQSRPAPSKGQTVGEVQFKIHLASPKCVFGVANVIST